MDTIQALFTRRSIRKYRSERVPEEKLETLLRAAMFAPSARNQQPWHFVVVDDREQLDRIRAAHPYAGMLATAGAAVVVCCEEALVTSDGNWINDCAAAVQNLMLAARAEGLGTCWLGVYPRPERMEPIGEIVGLPDGVIPHAVVALGVPDEEPRQPERFRPDRVHRNRW